MSINNSSFLKSSILRSASVISIATFLSRVSGFFRDVALAYFFGTGLFMQAFIVAFRLPNLLRNLIGEGAANTALVPVFSKMVYHKRQEEFINLCRFLFKFIILILSLVVILAQILSPALVRIIAPGFLGNLEKLELTIQLSRITFIYILLIGIVAFNTAILNSLNNFAPSAVSPVLLNISLILGAFISAKTLKIPVFGIAWAVVIGGIVQIALQLPWLIKNKIKPWHNLLILKIDPEVKNSSKRIFRLFWPRILGAAVYQINVFIDTIIASLSFLVGPGAVAAIYYANRIIQLPLGVFAFALSSALLPRLAALVAAKDNQGLINSLGFSLKVIMAIMLPVSLLFAFLGPAIVEAIFQRGEFNLFSTQITSWALLFYCPGLFFFAAVKIILACFYAFEDTRRPVKIALICLLVNLILNCLLAIPLKLGGLALASSLSAALNLTLLCKYLKKYIPDLDYVKIFALPFLRLIFPTLVMVFILNWSWQNIFLSYSLIPRLVFNLVLSGLIYLAVGLIFKISEIKDTLRWILGKE